MSARRLDGEALARRIAARVRERAAEVAAARGFPPGLAVLAVGEDSASRLYTRRQLKACEEAGLRAEVRALPAGASESEVLRALEELAQDGRFDAVLVESPLPGRLSLARILSLLPPEKDAEGLSPANAGRLYSAKSLEEAASAGVVIPPTPGAILEILKASGAAVAGSEAVVVGRSSVVGRPAAHLLTCLDATVTLCHSRTRDLGSHLRRADIVVAALGRPRFIRGEDLKPGATVIDAGVNVDGSRVVGDVDFESASRVAAAITPVPGGVGPVTTAMLLSNAVAAAERRR